MANPGPMDWMTDFSKALGDLRTPGVDMGALVAMQRKNIEAVTQANQIALEGAQAVMRHQLELTRRGMEQFSEMMAGLFQPNGSMESRVAKHAEFSKSAIEKGLSDAREIADLVTKANAEALDVLTRRVAETLEELRDLAQKRSARD
jgi:phasin family protein